MSDTSILTGSLPAELANAVSDAIFAAQQRGMELDEAVCVVLGVAADYGRAEYSDRYLPALCSVVLSRAGQPLPEQTKKGAPA